MDEQNGYTGLAPKGFGVPMSRESSTPFLSAAIAPPQLRPLSTGEVLDRTFTLYRRRFWLFVAISALPAVVVTLSSAARMVYVAFTHRVDVIRPGSSPDVLASAVNTTLLLQMYFLPATVLFIIAFGVSHAAAVHAVSRINRGAETTAADCYRAVRRQWPRWTGIALRQLWSLLWPVIPVLAVLVGAFAVPGVRGNTLVVGAVSLLSAILLPGSSVFGIINLLRNALGMPAGVQEQLSVNEAMRRSKALVAGRKGRIFLTLLLVYALQVVAGGLQVPFVLLAAATRGAQHALLQIIELLISFVATTLVSPVASIALTLLYVDERVRREGYDIELLMEHSFANHAAEARPPAWPGSPA